MIITVIEKVHDVKQCLSKKELAIYRLLSPGRKKQWALGHCALKESYKRNKKRSKLRHDEIIIKKDRRGAPYISNEPLLKCSITHSGDFAIAAINKNSIGIDLELLRKRSEHFIDYITTPKEAKLAVYEDSPITTLWVIKESVLKALGRGLTISPRNAEIRSRFKSSWRVVVNEPRIKEKKWKVRTIKFRKYIMAIATKNGEKPELNWYKPPRIYSAQE
ncbi:MAG: 4'-phosphopantetheinyl transferase superfamily protein [Nanoarchaeota archaeon]